MQSWFSINSGARNESQHSIWFHAADLPLLVSPKVLRKRNCGQIDLAKLEKEKIVIIEVKSSDRGIEVGMKSKQNTRLKKSASFLAFLFRRQIEVKFIR